MASTDAVSATSSALGLNSPSTTSLNSGTSADFDRFLKLLTAQMRFQDPMDPTDPTQFVAQLAQFSQVEQQVKTNTLLQGLADSLAGSGSLTQNAALIGKTVKTSPTSVVVPASGDVSLTVNADGNGLSSLRLEVLDDKGVVLRHISLASGESTISFNGLNDAGVRLEAGSYKARVVGDDASGTRQVAGGLVSNGKITEIRRDSTGAYSLVLENGSLVAASDVSSLGI